MSVITGPFGQQTSFGSGITNKNISDDKPSFSNNNNNAVTEKKEFKEVGAAWQKTAKNGRSYLVVKITLDDGTVKILNMFLNNKSNDSQPDFIAFKD